MSVLIVGIGNENRGDDGVGPVVARALAARQLPGVRVVETSDGGVGLLDHWRDADCVLLVDGVQSDATPGALHEIDLHTQPLPTHLMACSSHVFGLAQVIELARTLRRLPTVLRLYGIEGENFGLGKGLSPAVARRVPQLVAQIVAQVGREEIAGLTPNAG